MAGPTPTPHPAWQPDTRAIHGRRFDNPLHSVAEPLVPTATFYFRTTEELRAFQNQSLHQRPNDYPRHEYGRYGNPTVAAAEARLAELETADEAILVASGMAAVTAVLLTYLRAGDHVIFTADVYRRTRQFFQEWLPRWGIQSTMVPPNDFAALERAITPRTRLLYSETPTNPFLRVLDLERWVAIAQKHGLLTVLDATFATPINLQPLAYGVDIVLHSASKYLGGHHDLLAGVIAGSRARLEPIRTFLGTLGAIPSPHVAHELLRGLKTLPLRVRHQNRSGQIVAEFLHRHPAVAQVWYPGLPSHPDHAIAQRVLRGFGGVVTFTLRGSLDDALAFVDALEIPLMAPSLGGTETLISPVALMSFASYTPEERAALGIDDTLMRLALGLEAPEDLIRDLDQALRWMQHRPRSFQRPKSEITPTPAAAYAPGGAITTAAPAPRGASGQ